MVRGNGSGDKVSISQVYDLVDRKINEVNNSVLRLETKFDTLEQGRLSSLEKDFANFQGRISIVAGIVSIGIGVFFTLLNYFLK